MKTTKRFEAAVSKLYNAFHSGELSYGDCTRCAVGNICNNERDWSSGFCGISKSSSVESQLYERGLSEQGKEVVSKSGYSLLELAYVEFYFMMGITNGTEEIEGVADNFKGLCAVVEYLCELDGIPNIMDYTSLFETENEKPKKELVAVFQ